jgi:hypothetical protein
MHAHVAVSDQVSQLSADNVLMEWFLMQAYHQEE